MNKNNKSFVVGIALFTIIILSGITYTFFSAPVSNANNEKLSTTTATLTLVFDDNDNGINSSLNLGESIVKKFTIENTGTVPAYGKINWVDLVNTYTEDSLTWKLEQSTSENGTYTTVEEGKVPNSSSETTILLSDGLLVPEEYTIYYKLTITLNSLSVNQNSDINANMHSKFNLQAGKPVLTAVQQIRNLATNGNPSSTEEFGAPSNMMYVLNFNNEMWGPYGSLSECQEDGNGGYGENVEYTCTLNPSTNKYESVLNGILETRNLSGQVWNFVKSIEQIIH